MFGWGSNENKQVGNWDRIEITSPSRVKSFDRRIVQVACGQNFSTVVTDNGEVYSWGSNRVGQLGNSNNSDNSTPLRVDLQLEIVIGK